MYIRQDYDYKELKQFIDEDNIEIYNLIEEESEQDNFVLLVEDYFTETPTPEQLNYYIRGHKEILKQKLKEWSK